MRTLCRGFNRVAAPRIFVRTVDAGEDNFRGICCIQTWCNQAYPARGARHSFAVRTLPLLDDRYLTCAALSAPKFVHSLFGLQRIQWLLSCISLIRTHKVLSAGSSSVENHISFSIGLGFITTHFPHMFWLSGKDVSFADWSTALQRRQLSGFPTKLTDYAARLRFITQSRLLTDRKCQYFALAHQVPRSSWLQKWSRCCNMCPLASLGLQVYEPKVDRRHQEEVLTSTPRWLPTNLGNGITPGCCLQFSIEARDRKLDQQICRCEL